jgi:hypothetical protein
MSYRPLVRSDLRFAKREAGVSTTYNPIEQVNDGLLDGQRIGCFARGDPGEQSSLEQICGSIAPSARSQKWPLRTILHASVKLAYGISHQLCFDTEPIAVVSLQTDGISPVDLARIVEGYNIRISDEGRFMLVLNLDRCPGKDETIVLDGARVVKCRMFGIAPKSTNPDKSSLEHESVNLVGPWKHRLKTSSQRPNTPGLLL